MVAKAGFIRIFIYTTKYGFRKYFVTKDNDKITLGKSEEYSQILGPDGQPLINLPQGRLSKCFSEDKRGIDSQIPPHGYQSGA